MNTPPDWLPGKEAFPAPGPMPTPLPDEPREEFDQRYSGDEHFGAVDWR